MSWPGVGPARGTEGNRVAMSEKPTFVTVDQELIRRAIDSCETAIEYLTELLSAHKNRQIAATYERELAAAKRTRDDLRTAMGWPEIW